MFDFALLAKGGADKADRSTAVALDFEVERKRFAFNGHTISIIDSTNQVKIDYCMATNEMKNGCGLSTEALLAGNLKRRCAKSGARPAGARLTREGLQYQGLGGTSQCEATRNQSIPPRPTDTGSDPGVHAEHSSPTHPQKAGTYVRIAIQKNKRPDRSHPAHAAERSLYPAWPSAGARAIRPLERCVAMGRFACQIASCAKFQTMVSNCPKQFWKVIA